MPASDSKCNSLIPTAESQLFQTLTCTTVRIFIFHRKFLGILSFLWTVVLAHHSSQLAWDISIATPGISTKTLFQPQTPSYHCRHWHWMPSLESQSGNVSCLQRTLLLCYSQPLRELVARLPGPRIVKAGWLFQFTHTVTFSSGHKHTARMAGSRQKTRLAATR